MGTTPVSSLPLSLIVPITVTVSPAGTPGLTFNQGIIVGPSDVISSLPGQILREYTGLTGMLQDGFLDTDPEYLSATLYFGQSPAPSVLWVGRQDLTSIAQGIAASGNLGTGYLIDDIVTVTQAGASAGQFQVTNITAGGDIAFESTMATANSGSISLSVTSATGIQVGMTVNGTGIPAATTVQTVVGTTITISQATTSALSSATVTFSGLAVYAGGTGYSIANSLSTTGGNGTGLEIDITAIGQTPLQSIQACRAASPLWYSCMFVGTATDSDYEAIAAYIEAVQPASTFFLTSGSSTIVNGTTGNLFAVLQALNYRRTFCVYSTPQGGTYPTNVYASSGALGTAMGLNTGTPGSYFTLAFKTIVGVGPEPLTQTQVSTICGTFNRSSPGLNGNVMLNWQNGSYSFLENGTMIGGVFFDITLGIDMLANAIQTNVMNLFTSQPSIPITDAGVNQVKSVIQTAINQSQQIGFVAPQGVWLGQNIGTGSLEITNGQSLPSGYAIYAPPVATLSQGQRAARQLPPITLAIICAEAGQSVAIAVDVQL